MNAVDHWWTWNHRHKSFPLSFVPARNNTPLKFSQMAQIPVDLTRVQFGRFLKILQFEAISELFAAITMRMWKYDFPDCGSSFSLDLYGSWSRSGFVLTSSVWNLIFKPPDINASGKKIYPANEIWQNLRKILAITSGDVTFYNIADTAALGAPETWNFPFLDVWI